MLYHPDGGQSFAPRDGVDFVSEFGCHLEVPLLAPR
jgi:hypothetical protein